MKGRLSLAPRSSKGRCSSNHPHEGDVLKHFLERSLFFKTISMKETRKWNEDEDEERKDFSIFDSSISDEDQDSAYIKKTLSRVRRDKVLLVVKVEDF